jgi:hypothetical protein
MNGNRTVPPARITVFSQAEVNDDEAEAFYQLYERAFAPLRTLAAARQELTRSEFLDEMRDARVVKLVARREDGQPLGLATLATDLACVPWISPEFFAARYPRHAARNALYYVGAILAEREARRGGAVESLIDSITQRVMDDDAICLYDICGYNDGHLSLHARIESRAGTIVPVTSERLDVQTYYATYEVGATP